MSIEGQVDLKRKYADLTEAYHVIKDRIKQLKEYTDLTEAYDTIKNRAKQLKDKDSEIQQFKTQLKKSMSSLIDEGLRLKLILIDEHLHKQSTFNRFYLKEELLEICPKVIEAKRLKIDEDRFYFVIESETVPPMLVCSQNQSSKISNLLYVHGWSEEGRKLILFDNKL